MCIRDSAWTSWFHLFLRKLCLSTACFEYNKASLNAYFNFVITDAQVRIATRVVMSGYRRQRFVISRRVGVARAHRACSIGDARQTPMPTIRLPLLCEHNFSITGIFGYANEKLSTAMQSGQMTGVKRHAKTRMQIQMRTRKNKTPQSRSSTGFHRHFWRRRRDSNPRSRFWPRCSLSRGVPSTSRPRLPNFRLRQGGSATKPR